MQVIVLTNIITVPVLANYKTFCRQQRLAQLQQRADERLGSETAAQEAPTGEVLSTDVSVYASIISRLPLLAHVLSDIQSNISLRGICEFRMPSNYLE